MQNWGSARTKKLDEDWNGLNIVVFENFLA